MGAMSAWNRLTVAATIRRSLTPPLTIHLGEDVAIPPRLGDPS
jgi:hypothetical protein